MLRIDKDNFSYLYLPPSLSVTIPHLLICREKVMEWSEKNAFLITIYFPLSEFIMRLQFDRIQLIKLIKIILISLKLEFGFVI